MYIWYYVNVMYTYIYIGLWLTAVYTVHINKSFNAWADCLIVLEYYFCVVCNGLTFKIMISVILFCSIL